MSIKYSASLSERRHRTEELLRIPMDRRDARYKEELTTLLTTDLHVFTKLKEGGVSVYEISQFLTIDYFEADQTLISEGQQDVEYAYVVVTGIVGVFQQREIKRTKRSRIETSSFDRSPAELL